VEKEVDTGLVEKKTTACEEEMPGRVHTMTLF
jgi:hypothetical protein